MCFDTCTINIRVSIRVRGLHLVFSPSPYLSRKWSATVTYKIMRDLFDLPQEM